MIKVIIMIGLQGSGKSVKALQLAKEYEAVILSSDAYRKLEPTFDNNQIFEWLYKDMVSHIEKGLNVVLDSTNITIKFRKKVFEKLKKYDVEVIGYIMNTPIEICKERVEKRNLIKSQQNVPLNVIDKYMKSFEVPFFEEGFSEIIIDTIPDYNLSERLSIIKIMEKFDQKNPHHEFSLLEHSLLVADGLPHTWVEVGIFHDIGKLFTQHFDKEGIAHYYNHENVGTYALLSNLQWIPERKNILDILFGINYHMRPFDWKEEKTKEKWKAIFGEPKYKMLVQFNEIDIKSMKKE